MALPHPDMRALWGYLHSNGDGIVSFRESYLPNRTTGSTGLTLFKDSSFVEQNLIVS